MLNPAHVLEVAFLLLGAFLIGATIGSIARLVALRTRRPAATSAADKADIASSAESRSALVSAPTIDPIAQPAVPVVPSKVPTPDIAEASQASTKVETLAAMSEIRMPSVAPLPALEAKRPNAEMSPARIAGQTTSGRLVASPVVQEAPSQPAPVSGGISAEVIPFPLERAAEPAEELATFGATSGETAFVAALSDVSEVDSGKSTELLDQEVRAVETSPETVAPATADEMAVPPAAAEAVTALTPAAETASGEAPSSVGGPSDDEAAAMRAIEGNWSPRRGAGGQSRKAAVPDGLDAESAVAAAGLAVKAATDAAKAAVANQPADAPGKPVGIAAARHGVKDNLTNVIGILPIIETALNNIGVYHFDQIAEFTDDNVTWLEEHLGIAGRIGREHWREQARELAVVSERSRKVAGQQ